MKTISLLWLSIGSLVACAQPRTVIDLRKTLDEASASELATTARLRGELLRVSGVVERSGLKKQREVLARYSAHEGTTERTQAQYPYVILAPEDGKSGRAMCFFELSDIDDIAKLKAGDHAEFDAKLQEFLNKDGQEVMVVHCDVVK